MLILIRGQCGIRKSEVIYELWLDHSFLEDLLEICNLLLLLLELLLLLLSTIEIIRLSYTTHDATSLTHVRPSNNIKTRIRVRTLRSL